MSLQFKTDALALAADAIARTLEPPEALAPSQWAAAKLVMPDGPRQGDTWSSEETPYIIEPLDFLGPDSPVNEIAVMKAAQTGFTAMLIAAIAHSIDRDPCRMMVIQPTDAALSDFNREKLQPAIDASAALRNKVEPQTTRSSTGSTTYSKRYPGGSLTLAIASSAADLRSKTIRKLFRDEIDEYPDDLDGQGDPIGISDARLFAFLNRGDWKKADVSTPTIKGKSKIELRYEAGDKRRWFVPCPQCDEEFVFEFGPSFRYEQQHPFNAHYVAPCCGSIIEAHDKRSLVRRGRWVPTDSRPGAFPSYHFDQLSSPFVPWDDLAKAAVEAAASPRTLQVFFNMRLGRPYEVKGDAPDHVRLMERRESDLKRGQIPPRGVILTAAADVQMRGIWVEVVAFAQNRETWVVEAQYFDGSTENPSGEAFKQLEERVLEREWTDFYGNKRKIDALGVDSGYRSHVVYAWTRAKQRIHPSHGRETVLALKGVEGWGRPAIGTPGLVDIDLAGARVRRGARVWPIGTWPLKAAFYEDLRKLGRSAGQEADPPGYCHFPFWLDETYFRQITAEYLTDEVYRGKTQRVWKLGGSEKDNHLLDCRVYNMALAEHLGLSSLTEDEWSGLARERGVPVAVEAVAKATEDDDLDKRLERLGRLNAERFR